MWDAILEQGSMTSTNANFTCNMKKSIRGMEFVTTSTFYVDEGNLQRSVIASYDETLTINEFYGLLEWGNPSSKYKHYTYNNATKQYDSEELNSKFLHFYRDDLGIIIDLAFDDLAFDGEQGCYTCTQKISYPYDSDRINAKYEEIQIFFADGKLEEIHYLYNGADYWFTYSNYGSTNVDLPIANVY